MSNELMVKQNTDLSTDLLKKLAGDGEYLGYLTQVQRSSDLAGPPHEVPAGSFAYVKGTDPIVLGKSIVLALLCWRPCARIIDKSGDTKVTSYYQLNDPKFVAVKAASEKKPQEGNVIYYFGFEFLVAIDLPGKGTVFASYYANSATAHRLVREKLIDLLGMYVSFEGKYIETAKYKWWGIEAEKNTEGFALTVSQDEVDAQVAKFQSVMAEAPVEAEAEGDTAEDDR